MDDNISTQSLSQAAPQYLEEYPEAKEQWDALANLLNSMDGQDLQTLSEELTDLRAKMVEAETAWSAFRIELVGDEPAEIKRLLSDSAPYGFSILEGCLGEMANLHAALSRSFSEDGAEQ